MPVGAKILWPEKTKKSQPIDCTLTGMCETVWAPSMRTSAPCRLAAAVICSTGRIVPRLFEACVSETSFVRGPSYVSKASR